MRCGSGWRRPISSSPQRGCWTVLAPCSRPAIIRPHTTASSYAVPAPSQLARTPGSPRSARTSSPECRCSTGRAAPFPTATCSPTTGSFCGPWSAWPSCPRGAAANGWGGPTPPAVLGVIPSITLLPLYFELDGTFPNHEANPLDSANLVDLQAHVVATGADIGLAFDGDADRCFVVDETGHPVSPSAVTALVAARELHTEIGATVIYNLIASRAVPELVAERGGTPVRSRVGHSYIKALMADTGAIFGGEHSAHYYFRDFWGADSGMLAALHVLAALGEQERPLSDLMADYQRYEASGEINFTVLDAEACVDAVLKAFGTRIHAIDHLDGVTVDLGDGGSFNLRMWNTVCLLRLNGEARSTEEVDDIVGLVSQQVQAQVSSDTEVST